MPHMNHIYANNVTKPIRFDFNIIEKIKLKSTTRTYYPITAAIKHRKVNQNSPVKSNRNAHNRKNKNTKQAKSNRLTHRVLLLLLCWRFCCVTGGGRKALRGLLWRGSPECYCCCCCRYWGFRVSEIGDLTESESEELRSDFIYSQKGNGKL